MLTSSVTRSALILSVLNKNEFADAVGHVDILCVDGLDRRQETENVTVNAKAVTCPSAEGAIME